MPLLISALITNRGLTKVRNVLRGLKQAYGPEPIKRALWNREFSEGRWAFIAHTPGDVVYPFVERHCRRGSILDLGCGSGNTGCELAERSYTYYLGVDISDVALETARRRSREVDREDRNHYVRADIASYAPKRAFDVILFRESIYYLPRHRIGGVLDRYAGFLAKDGVFIVRWHDQQKQWQTLIDLIAHRFSIVERHDGGGAGPYVVVFR